MTSDHDSLLAALTATPDAEGEDGYLTFREIMRRVEMGDNKLYAMLRQLSDDGLLECKRVSRRTITGGVQGVPAYRLRHKTADPAS